MTVTTIAATRYVGRGMHRVEDATAVTTDAINGERGK
jgi:hypothetical protein